MSQHSKTVILITGASSGIGEATARKLAQQSNFSLVLVARNQQKLETLAEELRTYSSSDVMVYPLDLTKLELIPSMVEAVLSQLGRLDVVLHVAGAGDFKPALDINLEEVENQFQLNTLSGIILSQAAGQQMVKQGSGKILIVASMSGKLPTPQSSVYAASKSAINTYAAALVWDRARQYRLVDPWIWTLFPIYYLAFGLLNGLVLKWPIPGADHSPFAYFFLDVTEYGWPYVLQYAAIIFVAYLLVGYLLFAFKNKIWQKSGKIG